MEIIRLLGYTEVEKVHIAEQFLLPKQLKANGLEERKVTFSRNPMLAIIRRYTRKADIPREIPAEKAGTSGRAIN